MKKEEYLKMAFELFNKGTISDEVYDCMISNADDFCDD